jgi:hypothetical protein
MPDPAKSSGALPLYRVLVEEYNHQFPDSPISLAEIEAQRKTYEEAYDRDNRPDPGSEPAAHAAARRDSDVERDEGEEREERQKAVNYRLVKEFYLRVHRNEKEKGIARSALCFSGGGIRSATFGLGVAQGLSRLGLLKSFDFLSTVSGGGYLGSWLSAWIRREAQGVEKVEADLSSPPRYPLSPEPGPVSHLRSYSRYMSPKLGLLSADTWTLVGIFLRNLTLNWLVLPPLLAAVLMLPRVSVLLARHQPGPWMPQIVFGLGFLAGIVAIAYIAINRPSLADRPSLFTFPQAWRSQEGFLRLCLLPLALMAVCVSLYWAWVPVDPEHLSFDLFGWHLAPLPAFVLFGIAMHAGGYALAQLFVRSHWREVLGVIVTGGLGGLAAWGVAKNLFPIVQGWDATERYVSFAAPTLLFLFLLAATLFVGLASKYTDDEDREWLARAGAWILIFIALRSGLGLLVIYGPVAWHSLGVRLMTAIGGASGLVTLLVGHSSKTGASEKKRGEPLSLPEKGANVALALAAPLFALTLLVGLAFATTFLIRGVTALLISGGHFLQGFEWPPEPYLSDDPYEHLSTLYHSPSWVVLGLLLALVAVGCLMGTFVDINRFSLHAAYRDRLIRAYLGASRVHGERHPNPFSGFDQDDNLEMAELVRDRDRVPNRRPFHVINAALNLVAGKKLSWQDRKAESFTFSALHSGSYCLGYRSSERYGYHKDRGTAVSLGTALAISGAAASPNMGYHSSPVVTFLLALFNIRLGWWLGNPGPAGETTYDKPGPLFAPKALLAEAFGFTDDEHRYVYLSDGGHFENLGLYEMVLRRCRYIVVSDGGADGDFSFEDLGNALERIKIDMGIPIEFERGVPMRRQDVGKEGYDAAVRQPAFPYCAVAKIRYSCVDHLETGENSDLGDRSKVGDLGDIDGWLLYVKPSLNGTEPVDIFHYAKLHPTFPHESTANQLYSEAQFESYRALGSHVMSAISGTLLPGVDLPAFFAQAATYAKGQG